MQGIPFELTDKVRATIVEAASKGLLIKDIAAAIGLKNYAHFCNVIRKNFPEIDELIEEGQRQGREILMNMSWDIITNVRDPARAQELQRLNRRLKTEEPESVGVDANGMGVSEITFRVIERKSAEPKAE
jgi:hypothetical protein